MPGPGANPGLFLFPLPFFAHFPFLQYNGSHAAHKRRSESRRRPGPAG